MYLTVIHAAATVQSDNPDLKKNEKLKKNGGLKKCYTDEGTQSDYRYVTVIRRQATACYCLLDMTPPMLPTMPANMLALG